jgi:hypothetical protein
MTMDARDFAMAALRDLAVDFGTAPPRTPDEMQAFGAGVRGVLYEARETARGLRGVIDELSPGAIRVAWEGETANRGVMGRLWRWLARPFGGLWRTYVARYAALTGGGQR